MKVRTAMDPTVILGNIGADALELATDRITKILTGNAHCSSCHTYHHGHFVVKFEGPIINICLIKIKVIGKIA